MTHLLLVWMEWRRKNNLSQRAAAERVGIDRNVVANWELGRSTPKRSNAKKICAALGVPYEEHSKRIVPDTPCPHCGARVPGPEFGALFCFACGGQIAKKCPGCSITSHKADARFCWSCGTSLEGAGTGVAATLLRTPGDGDGQSGTGTAETKPLSDR